MSMYKELIERTKVASLSLKLAGIDGDALERIAMAANALAAAVEDASARIAALEAKADLKSMVNDPTFGELIGKIAATTMAAMETPAAEAPVAPAAEAPKAKGKR